MPRRASRLACALPGLQSRPSRGDRGRGAGEPVASLGPRRGRGRARAPRHHRRQDCGAGGGRSLGLAQGQGGAGIRRQRGARAGLQAIPVIDLMRGPGRPRAIRAIGRPTGGSNRRSRRPATRWMSCGACSRSIHSRRSMSPISTRSSATGITSRRSAAFAKRSRRYKCGSTTAQLTSAAIEALIDADLGAPVIGSELQRDSALIAQHRDSRRVVLSLDFRGDAFQGLGDPGRTGALAAAGHRHDACARRQRRRSRSRADRCDTIDRRRSRNLCRRGRARRGRSLGAQGRGRRGALDRDRAARAANCRGGSGGSSLTRIRFSCRRDRTA